MLNTTTTVGIANPDEFPNLHLSGTSVSIPVIDFERMTVDHRDGEWVRTGVTVALHFDGPAEQAAWLRRLAVAAEELAEQIELAAAEAKVAAGIALATTDSEYGGER